MASSVSKRNSKNQHNIIETAPKATLLMLLAGLFILIIGAFFIQILESPVVFSAPWACFALYAGAATGGAFCSLRLDGKDIAACTFIASLILCALLILAKAFVKAPENPDDSLISFIMHLLVPLSALIGALICNWMKANKGIKKRKNHYRSKK